MGIKRQSGEIRIRGKSHFQFAMIASMCSLLIMPALTQGQTDQDGGKAAAEQRYGLNQLFKEEFLAENLFEVIRKASAIPVTDRFEFLSRWVLPGPDHPGLRMTGDFTQTQPAQAAYQPGIENPGIGGQIVSPVYLWIDAAKELGRLPECLTKVEGAVIPDTEPQRRARIGLLVLLNLEMGDQPAASKHFQELYELLQPATADEQWSEMLIIDQSVRRFATIDAAAKFIADFRTLKLQQSRSSRSSLWQAQIQSLLAYSPSVKADQAAGKTSTFKDWIPVTAATAATRGQGYPVARWHRDGLKIQKHVSHVEDFLFYRSPLRGNFEVECDLIESSQVLIGGTYLGANLDRRTLDLGTFRAPSPGEPVNPQFSSLWPSRRYRAVIRDGVRSITINGRPVKTEEQSDNADPWLAIRCAGPSHGAVHDFRITGQPQVLDSVSLSSSRELTGWIAYHNEAVLHETSGWTHVDDAESTGWIVGHPNPEVAGMSMEGLLRYQRPLVEDGSIDCEFFYDPDAYEAHPALDRLAFILHPSGVREHWIGDGRYDRSDLDPNNQIEDAACRRGPAELPLLVRAWNQLRLSLRGQTVTIILNGQLVYERHLEPNNQRTFGLFHFLGKSAVRVRNAVMRGDWPKAVPPVAAQELADVTTDKLDAELAGLKSVFSHDFQKDGIPDQYFKSPFPGLTLRVIPGPQGVQASQRSAGPHLGFNIHPRFTLGGDFDIEAAFTGLRIEGSGDAGIMLNTALEGEMHHEFRALRMKTTHGNQELHSSVSFVRPGGDRTYVGDSKGFEAVRGRIRLARRGQRVFYLFAENDSDHFILFGSEPSPDADTAVDGIFLHSYCNGVSISQVTWTRLVLRAERMKWYSPQKSPAPRNHLSVMQADGKALQIVASPKSVGFASVESPEWSPDQSRILMEMSNGTPSKSHIFVVNADGANLTDLGVGRTPSFSNDGTRIVCSVPGKGIVTMQSDGTARQVLSSTGWGAQWSPDGSWIAFAEGENITILDVNSLKSSQLLKGAAAERYRSIVNLGWSHDSRSITFKGQRRDIARQELCLVALDSPSEFKVLHPNAHAISPHVTFSSDNQNVIVGITGVASRETRLYALNCKQPGPASPIFAVPLAAHNVSGCSWSHDGKWIAITSLASTPYFEWVNGPIAD